MMRDNLCDKVNDGDIIFFGDERFQVFKANKKAKIKHLAVVDTGHGVSSVDAQIFREATSNFAPPKPGGNFKYASNGLSGKFYGYVTYAQRYVKTIPVLFSGGELPVDKYRDVSLTCFVSGDEEAYKALQTSFGEVELEYAAVVPAQVGLQKTADVKGFTKLDLMAYVVHVNGEGKLSRDPIMKKVAALEGKPWIPTSNTGYFGGGPGNDKGTLVHAGKGKYGRILYGLGQVGKERASKVLARLGPEPGRI